MSTGVSAIEAVVSTAVTEAAVFVMQAESTGFDTPSSAELFRGATLDTALCLLQAHAETAVRCHAVLVRFVAGLLQATIALEVRAVRIARALRFTAAAMDRAMERAIADHTLLWAQCSLARIQCAAEFAMALHSPQLDSGQRRAFCRRLKCLMLALTWDCLPSQDAAA